MKNDLTRFILTGQSEALRKDYIPLVNNFNTHLMIISTQNY